MYTLKRDDEILATSQDLITYVPEQHSWRIGPAALYYDAEKAAAVTYEPVHRTVMTPLEFKGLFSLQERFAIETARGYSGTDATAAGVKLMLNIFFSDIDDVRTTRVDVSDPRVVDGLDFCVAQTFITAESAAAKKLGIPE